MLQINTLLTRQASPDISHKADATVHLLTPRIHFDLDPMNDTRDIHTQHAINAENFWSQVNLAEELHSDAWPGIITDEEYWYETRYRPGERENRTITPSLKTFLSGDLNSDLYVSHAPPIRIPFTLHRSDGEINPRTTPSVFLQNKKRRRLPRF